MRWLIILLLLIPVVSAENLTLSWETGLILPAESDTQLIDVAEASTQDFGSELLVGAGTSFFLFSGGSEPSLYIPFRRLTYMDTIDYAGSGRKDHIAVASNSRIEVHTLSEDYELKWNYSLSGIKALRSGDADGDGYEDELIVATTEKLYVFKPRDNRLLKSFPIERGAESVEVINGSTTAFVVGYKKEDRGKVVVYSNSGGIIWSLDFQKPVNYVLAFDANEDGEEEIIVKYGNGDATDDFAVYTRSGKLLWRFYDTASVSACDFDGNGIRDDIVAVGLKISALSGKGEVLASYSKSDIPANSKPSKLKAVQCLAFQGDNIANDIAIVGYVSKQGYYIYGVGDFYKEEKEEEQGNKPPVAKAGEDITVKYGEAVVLSALDSYDPDGEIISYTWLEGEKVLSYNPAFSINSSELGVGVHVIILKVRDDKGATSMDSVVVKVIGEEKKNIPPVAKITGNLTVEEGSPIKLSALESKDRDGNITAYYWIYNNHVIGTDPVLIYNLPAGEHIIKLRVEDNSGASDETSVKVKVVPKKVEEAPPEQPKKELPLKTIASTAVAVLLTIATFLGRRRLG